jgi:hypothetical protein
LVAVVRADPQACSLDGTLAVILQGIVPIIGVMFVAGFDLAAAETASWSVTRERIGGRTEPMDEQTSLLAAYHAPA